MVVRLYFLQSFSQQQVAPQKWQYHRVFYRINTKAGTRRIGMGEKAISILSKVKNYLFKKKVCFRLKMLWQFRSVIVCSSLEKTP